MEGESKMKKRWNMLTSLFLVLCMVCQPVLAANNSSSFQSMETSVLTEENLDTNSDDASEVPVENSTETNSKVDSKVISDVKDDVLEAIGDALQVGNMQTFDVTPETNDTNEKLEEITAEGIEITDADAYGVGSRIVLRGITNDETREGAEYGYFYYYEDELYEIASFEQLEEVEWIPEAAGTYTLVFAILYNDLLYMCAGDLEIEDAYVSVKAIGTSIEDNKVKISPKVTTNIVDTELTYTYQIYDLQKHCWYTLEGDDSDTSRFWKPETAGDYWIHVTVKAETGVTGVHTIGYSVKLPSITGFSLNTEPKQLYTKTVVLKGEVESLSNQKLTYEYLAYDGYYWTSLSKTDSLDIYEFKPEKPGTYLLCFQIYDEKGTVLGQSFLAYEAEAEYVNIQGVSVNRVKEKEFELDMVLDSNTEELEYRWLYYDLDDAVWGLIQDWSETKEATWSAPDFGTYWIHAEARTIADSKNVATYTGGYVIEKFKTTLKDLQVYTPDFRTYYIQQNVETNDSTLTYTYMIYDVKAKEWMALPQCGVNTYWQPNKSGGYWIHTIITSSSGDTYQNTVGYYIQGYRIGTFGFSENLQVGKTVELSMKGYDFFGENYTFTYSQWSPDGWYTIYEGDEEGSVEWTPGIVGYYAFWCQVKTSDGEVVDQYVLNISPNDFLKNGWYYEDGYKFYYIDGVKQLDVEDIIGKQSSYVLKVNRTTCTVTVYASDGANGYIIPVKRFACSVGLPATPTPTGSFYTSAKYKWWQLMGPTWGQYCTRIVGGILFHSVSGAEKSPYNVDPGKYNLLGQPASAGCVRLCVKDARWIYDNCKLGTNVIIYDSSDPGPLGRGPVYRITNPNQNWDPTDTFENPV